MDGWVKLHRKLLEWEWKTDKNCFLLFVHLLLVACFKQTKFCGRVLNAGQYICTVRRLAADTGLTENEVRGALRKLTKTGELSTESTNKFTLVTITNYAFYQGWDFETAKQSTNEEQAANFQITAKNETENKHNNKNNNLNNSTIFYNHIYYIYNREYKNFDFIRDEVEEESSTIFFETFVLSLAESGINIFIKKGLEGRPKVLDILIRENV